MKQSSMNSFSRAVKYKAIFLSTENYKAYGEEILSQLIVII